MASVTKFLFENSFDTETRLLEDEEAQSNEFVPPTFSQAELDTARNEGVQAGKEEATNQASDATERQAAQALEIIGVKLEEILQASETMRVEALENAIVVAAAIVRKIFPTLERQNGLGEVHRLIETTVDRLMDEPRIVVHVSQQTHETISEVMHDLAISKGFNGQVVVLADAGMQAGNCRIDWKNGSACRDAEALWTAIDDVIKGNLGDHASDLMNAAENNAAEIDDGPIAAEDLLGDGNGFGEALPDPFGELGGDIQQELPPTTDGAGGPDETNDDSP